MTWVYEIPVASGLLFTRVMTDWLLCITRLSLGFKDPKSNWCIIVLPYPPGLSLTWSKWLRPLPIGLYLLLSALIFYLECAALKSLHLLDCFVCLHMGQGLHLLCLQCSTPSRTAICKGLIPTYRFSAAMHCPRSSCGCANSLLTVFKFKFKFEF